MTQRKGMFAMLLFFSSLGIFGFFVMHLDFNICYFCSQKAAKSSSLESDYIAKTFATLPEADCKQQNPFLVLLVTTKLAEKEARMAIRKTWGQERIIHGKRVVAFFLLGKSINPSSDEVGLSEEVATYRDIIRKDFVDSYFNLTMKTVMALEWIVHFCPQTLYVMKTDTDMFVNTMYLVELLVRRNQTSNLFTGFAKPNDAPIRNVHSKWYVGKSEYEHDRYPPFCSGTGYVFSVDVVQKVYKISYTVPYFKLEDVYIGMCLDKLKIPIQNLHSKQIFFVGRPLFSVCSYRKLITSHGVSPAEIIQYWEALQKGQEEKC